MKKKLVAFIIATITILSFGLTTMAAENSWSIVNGYGTVKNTGKGIEVEGDTVLANGYGGLCYMPEAVHEAVAVEFQVMAYPTTTHYFSIGLLDTKNVFWDTAGTMSKGIMTRVSVTTDGNTLQTSGLNITGGTVQAIDVIQSPLKPIGVSHMLTMYREGSDWVYSLDGVVANKIPVSSAKLGNTSYLSVGAYGSSSMELMVTNVYIDEAVTAEMKDGTFIKNLAGDEASSRVYYDDDGRLFIGETTKDSVLSYTEPVYLVNESQNQEADPIMYALIGATGLTLVLSIFVIISEMRKGKSNKKREEVG